MKGRGNYLCLHRFEALRRQPGDQVARRSRSRSRRSTNGRAAPRPAIAPRSRTCRRICRSGRKSPPRAKTASARTARGTTTVSSRGCASAPPNPMSSSSIITCCARTPRSGRARSAKSSRLPLRDRRRGAPARRRRHAVFRHRGQQLPGRRARARRRARRGRRRSSLIASATDDLRGDVERLRIDARIFFSALQMIALRGRPGRRRTPRARRALDAGPRQRRWPAAWSARSRRWRRRSR